MKNMKVLENFDRFIGAELYHCIDEIDMMAATIGLRVNVLDSIFPENNDVETDRLNVHVDDKEVVKKFSIR